MKNSKLTFGKAARWVPQKPTIEEVELWLNGDFRHCRRIKQNSKRSVYALYVPGQANPSYYLKHDHPQKVGDIFRSWLYPKVYGEFRALTLLQQKGIAAVFPVACGYRGGKGVLITKALNKGVIGEDLLPQLRESTTRRKRFLAGLAHLLGKMLAENIFHPDFHFGNVLAVEEEENTRCVLVDVHGMKNKRGLLLRQKIAMLRPLAGLLQDLNEEEEKILLPVLFPNADLTLLSKIKQCIVQAALRQMQHKWPKRRRKLLNASGRSNSLCVFARHNDETWHYRPGFDLPLAREIINKHKAREFMPREEKSEAEVFSLIEHAGGKFLVREFSCPDRRRDCRIWLNNWRLEIFGFLVPKYLAWLGTNAGSWFIVEQIRAVTLQQRLSDAAADGAQTEIILKELRRLLEKLCAWRIFHQKLDASNILVAGQSPGNLKLYLVDNDNVQFDCQIRDKHKKIQYRRLEKTLPPGEALRKLYDYFLGTI